MTEPDTAPDQPTSAGSRATAGPKARATGSAPTKKVGLIRLLRRKGGADVAAICRTLGWQSHTTRAALSGLRKAGYEIVAEKPGPGRPPVYRIAADPAAGARR